MADMFALHATAQAVEKAQGKLQQVRSVLGAAKKQARQEPDLDNLHVTLYQAECLVAETQGVLDAMEGWLNPSGEDDKP